MTKPDSTGRKGGNIYLLFSSFFVYPFILEYSNTRIRRAQIDSDSDHDLFLCCEFLLLVLLALECYVLCFFFFGFMKRELGSEKQGKLIV